MKNSEITKITGDRYNIFGKNLTRCNPTKEESKLVDDKIKENEMSKDELTPSMVLEVSLDIEERIEILCFIEKKYQNSQKNLIASITILILSIILGYEYFSIIFLLPVIIFYSRVINFKKDYKFRSGFLNFAIWFKNEICPIVYNKNHKINLPFELNDKELEEYKQNKKKWLLKYSHFFLFCVFNYSAAPCIPGAVPVYIVLSTNIFLVGSHANPPLGSPPFEVTKSINFSKTKFISSLYFLATKPGVCL